MYHVDRNKENSSDTYNIIKTYQTNNEKYLCANVLLCRFMFIQMHLRIRYR